MTNRSASDAQPWAHPEAAEHVALGGERLLIRPIRAADADAHRAFAARLPSEDLRLRFFTGVAALSDADIARFTAVDHISETAIIAVREASGETVGVVRLACVPGQSEGEFAIVVQPDMKRKGLGSLLLSRMIDWARRRGLSAITGEVLAENAVMLRLARRLGCELSREPGAPGVIQARLALSTAESPSVTGAFLSRCPGGR